MTEYVITLFVCGLTIGAAFVVFLAIAVLCGSTRRLERKVDVLLKHAGLDVEELATREARTLVDAGNKIQAIKAYREFTGCGLAEAKAKVESFQQSA